MRTDMETAVDPDVMSHNETAASSEEPARHASHVRRRLHEHGRTADLERPDEE
jgi:hypothetical protein